MQVEVTTFEPWLNSPAHTYASGRRYSINITSPSQAYFPRIKRRNRRSSMDKVKYAYMRVALLFCTSILITWVPASINRIYGLQHPQNPSYVLNIGSAMVLPLQGFWNTIIYFVTSLSICKSVLAEWRAKSKAGVVRGRETEWGEGRRLEIVHLGGRRVEAEDEDSDVEKESDSLEELNSAKHRSLGDFEGCV